MDMGEYLLKRKQNSEEIKNRIVSVVRKHGINVDGRVEYNGTAINIEDRDWYIKMWIRLMWDNNADKCVIYMSNIKFTEACQRKGIFTEIINSLKKDKYIDNIVIQSVSSNSMRDWCKKHRFKPNLYESDFYWRA